MVVQLALLSLVVLFYAMTQRVIAVNQNNYTLATVVLSAVSTIYTALIVDQSSSPSVLTYGVLVAQLLFTLANFAGSYVLSSADYVYPEKSIQNIAHTLLISVGVVTTIQQGFFVLTPSIPVWQSVLIVVGLAVVVSALFAYYVFDSLPGSPFTTVVPPSSRQNTTLFVSLFVFSLSFVASAYNWLVHYQVVKAAGSSVTSQQLQLRDHLSKYTGGLLAMAVHAFIVIRETYIPFIPVTAAERRNYLVFVYGLYYGGLLLISWSMADL